MTITLPRHRHGLVLFILLNVADLALTGHLVWLGAGGVYEANWLAGWVLDQHGLTGLAILKALSVAVVASVIGTVYLYRPRMARCLAAFGCVVVGGVVLYSTALWAQLELAPLPPGYKDLATIARDRQDLGDRVQRAAEFRVRLQQGAAALAAGRCTLADAVAGLSTAAQAKDAAFLRIVRETLGAQSNTAGLAALAVRDAVALLYEDGSWAARRRADALLSAYQATHGPALELHGVRSAPLTKEWPPQRWSRSAAPRHYAWQ
jgi:hypothetical protein